MTRILAHLVGDYVLQSHVMATRKTYSWVWAFIHAFVYGLPFLLLVSAPWQWAVIVGTHACIDRLAIARRWCEFYGVGFPGVWYAGTRALSTPIPGYDRIPDFVPPPPFLGVWLIIIVDNTFHLAINHAVLAMGG